MVGPGRALSMQGSRRWEGSSGVMAVARTGSAGDVCLRTTGNDIAHAVGLLLRRGTRARVHTRLTEGLGEAVDDFTCRVFGGFAWSGRCCAAGLGRGVDLGRSAVGRRAGRVERAGLL